ncbi:MAG: Mur ligase family protein [Planctomycetes bacterium]|nr:Mur ligase family protein [Planctomycetota bacterium]
MARSPSFERAGAVPGGLRLDRMRALVDALGRPDRAYRVVHVAGTKGKGTTCAAVASVLDRAGRRVGLYTSPHLVDLRERVRVGPRPAPDALWVEAGRAVRTAVASLGLEVGRDDGPTWFELCTALALEVFRRAAVEVAVLEVGLGGRLDATNVVTPDVAVITRLARDHAAVLGPDVPAIAAEKAGILKPGVLAAAAPGDPAAEAVVVARAAAVGAPLWLLGRDLGAEVLHDGPGGVRARLTTPRAVREVTAPVAAATVANLALALAALDRLLDPSALDAALAPGLARLRWRGRWDVLPGGLVVDGAHDEASFRALAATAAARLGPGPLVLLLAASRDKDLDAIADVLARWPTRPLEVVCCAARSPRATPPADLAALLTGRGVRAEAVEDGAGAALARATVLAAGRPVLACGSLFLAGEVLALRGEDAAAAWRD